MTHHDISKHELDNAVRRGKAREATEFRAQAVRYRPDQDAVEIVTTDNSGFLIPRSWIEPLAALDPMELTRLEIWPGGAAIELTEHDVHISVNGLLASSLPRMVPKAALASLFGRAGGTVTSAAKRASARQNGTKGGRPRKVAIAV